MTWQTLIVLQTIPAALLVLTLRHLSSRPITAQAPAAINAGTFLFLYPLGLIALPFIGTVSTGFLGRYLGWYCVEGAGFAIASLLLYKALHYLDAANVSILAISNTILTVILAWSFLNERFSLHQAFGMVALLAIIVYVLDLSKRQTHETHPRMRHRWIIAAGLCFASAIPFAIAMTTEKYLLGHMNAATYIAFGWGFQLIAAFLLALLLDARKLKLFRDINTTGEVALAGLLRGTAGILFIFAQIRSNNLAIVATISNFRVILITLLAAVLLKERRFFAEKVFASILAVLALAIIFWH